MSGAADRSVLDLFSAAAGGWSLGMHRAGFHTVAACEAIAWRRALYSENNPGVPVYDDVCTLTADRLVRDLGYLPAIVVGSPPCQDISSANTKGKGVEGERSGLFFEAIRIIGEVRPRWFALENSANLRTRGADRIIPELEALGYAVWPFVVRASDVGANHERGRSWVIGFNTRGISHTHDEGQLRCREHAEVEIMPSMERNASDATSDGRGSRRERGRSEPTAGLPQQACRDANTASQRHEGGRSRGYGPDGDGAAPVADAEMGRGTGPCATSPEPWADWNGGLAHHLRLDDGLSAWVAQQRIAVGGPRGTTAASLIVEAFGDAVVPQIPEAIGRAILRVEDALAAVHHRSAA